MFKLNINFWVTITQNKLNFIPIFESFKNSFLFFKTKYLTRQEKTDLLSVSILGFFPITYGNDDVVDSD